MCRGCIFSLSLCLDAAKVISFSLLSVVVCALRSNEHWRCPFYSDTSFPCIKRSFSLRKWNVLKGDCCFIVYYPLTILYAFNYWLMRYRNSLFYLIPICTKKFGKLIFVQIILWIEMVLKNLCCIIIFVKIISALFCAWRYFYNKKEITVRGYCE